MSTPRRCRDILIRDNSWKESDHVSARTSSRSDQGSLLDPPGLVEALHRGTAASIHVALESIGRHGTRAAAKDLGVSGLNPGQGPVT